jgi:hypothetical protein
MRYLNTEEADNYLHEVGMKIGEWGQLCDESGRRDVHWVNYRAPTTSRQQYNFARQVAEWLPKGNWKVFQIDYSTALRYNEDFFINRLLFGAGYTSALKTGGTLLFEFVDAKDNSDLWIDGELDEKSDEELLLTDLMFLFLMFECHGQIVSSSCRNGMRLSIQDGFVYFISFDSDDITKANVLLREYERA